MKKSLVYLSCLVIMCCLFSGSVAEAQAIISNHVMAYTINRHGEDYSIDGTIINVADKAIAKEIHILDEIITGKDRSYSFSIMMISAASNMIVAKISYPSAPVGTDLHYEVTRFNIFNKPSGNYYIVVEESREGVIGKFMLRIR